MIKINPPQRRDGLLIMPFRADGTSVMEAANIVEEQRNSLRVLSPDATIDMAQGVAQALEAMSKNIYDVIIFGDYLGLGPGITQVWDAAQSQRWFEGARINFVADPFGRLEKECWR